MSNQTVQFFDKLAHVWDDSNEHDIRQKLIDLSGFPENIVIADVGCGRGSMLPHLLKTNPKRIIAVDISKEMLKYAKKTSSDNRILFINEDVITASLPSLDAALLFNSYPHFSDKNALVRKLAESICPGGSVIIAHSRGRNHINNIHSKSDAMNVSVSLRPAQEEAKEFLPFFSTAEIYDEDQMYFIKMIRNK